jgi:hypothetical protein
MRPRLSQIDFWGKHSQSVIAILKDALTLFAEDDDLVGLSLETDMTRELFLRMLVARRALKDRGVHVPEGLPAIDARNAPTPQTAGSPAERKLPDIQWGYQDDQEPDAFKSARFFHIECKRLGNTTLNSSYVDEGIKRFVTLEHRYGKDVGNGAMVGYLVDGRPEEAIVDVNGASSNASLPQLNLISAGEPVSIYHHELERPFQKSPFRLLHAWVVTPKPMPGQTSGHSHSDLQDPEPLALRS